MDGAFGQLCIVIPDQDAVIAINSGTNKMQFILGLVWKHLLPSMGEEILNNTEFYDELSKKLQNLELPIDKDYNNSSNYMSNATEISGKYYNLQDNKIGFKQVSINFSNSEYELTIMDSKGKHAITGGIKQRLECKVNLFNEINIISSYGYWNNKNDFVIKCQLIETPFCYTITFSFEKNKIEFKITTNVSSSFLNDLPVLRGDLLI